MSTPADDPQTPVSPPADQPTAPKPAGTRKTAKRPPVPIGTATTGWALAGGILTVSAGIVSGPVAAIAAGAASTIIPLSVLMRRSRRARGGTGRRRARRADRRQRRMFNQASTGLGDLMSGFGMPSAAPGAGKPRNTTRRSSTNPTTGAGTSTTTSPGRAPASRTSGTGRTPSSGAPAPAPARASRGRAAGGKTPTVQKSQPARTAPAAPGRPAGSSGKSRSRAAGQTPPSNASRPAAATPRRRGPRTAAVLGMARRPARAVRAARDARHAQAAAKPPPAEPIRRGPLRKNPPRTRAGRAASRTNQWLDTWLSDRPSAAVGRGLKTYKKARQAGSATGGTFRDAYRAAWGFQDMPRSLRGRLGRLITGVAAGCVAAGRRSVRNGASRSWSTVTRRPYTPPTPAAAPAGAHADGKQTAPATPATPGPAAGTLAPATTTSCAPPTPPVGHRPPEPTHTGGPTMSRIRFAPTNIAADFYAACVKERPGTEDGALFTGEAQLQALGEAISLISSGVQMYAKNFDRDLGSYAPDLAGALGAIHRQLFTAAAASRELPGLFSRLQAADVQRRNTRGAHVANVPRR